MTKPEPDLFLNDARGIYLPRDFAQIVKREHVSGVSEDDWAVLEAGPDHELYWDVWTDVLDRATLAKDGRQWTLHQDGDLWLVPNGMEWSDETNWFVWPEEDGDELQA